MKEFINQLGLDWKLLLSQAINFFILLFVLKAFVYKPVLKMLKERKNKIEKGLGDAEEASNRLAKISLLEKEKIEEADQKSLKILQATEKRSKILEQDLLKKAEERQKEILDKADLAFKRQEEEAKESAFQQAAEIINQILVKTVELKPEQIDQALIAKAAKQLKE